MNISLPFRLYVPMLAIVLLTLACAQEAPPSPVAQTTALEAIPVVPALRGLPRPAKEVARVVRVIDGDTIEVEMNGSLYKVRYIGMDTPETVHPTRGVEPYGYEASERNRQLVEGKTVYLEKDMSETDRYGRLLRYVYLDNSSMVNAVLVLQGYAQVATFPPDVKYAVLFLELQRQAQEDGVGMWGLSGADSSEAGPGGCDPAYPDVCIPPPPPDLDCGEIPHRRFTVLPPDPHRFDGDRDGIGCER